MNSKSFCKSVLKLFLSVLIASFVFQNSEAQTPQLQLDSLQHLFEKEIVDTTRINLLNEMTFVSAGFDKEKSLSTALRALELAKKNKWQKGIAQSEKYLGIVLLESGEREAARAHILA
ncbi:MAG: hypothetical protein KDC64_06745, partial [Aequorivita sp.]|nr:hypothetical protein [Aequorivita sp.]